MTTDNRPKTSPTRRRLLQALGLAAAHNTIACSDAAQQHQVSIEALRGTSSLHANSLSDERLQTIRPAVERSLKQIEAVRRFEFHDQTEPITIFHPKA